MRSIVDLLRREAPSNLTAAPAYTRRGSSAPPIMSAMPGRSGREAHLGSMDAHATLFTIVDRTAHVVSSAEWKLYQVAKSGRDEDRIEVTSHPALDVFKRPNKFYTRQRLAEACAQHFLLTGESWRVVVRDRVKFPTELWPVRPDRLVPVPSAETFLLGYVYCEPDGTKVPLQVDDVLPVMRPSPLDPYRGIGPIGALIARMYGARAAEEWNANFFRNSALPGGIIEFPERLSDEEWHEFTERWREAHQGVSNAHRVALLENGMKWVDRKFTHKDMQFVEAHDVTRETIREAYGYPKPMLGAVDDVNRANADAGELVFARWLVKPTLQREREMWNELFLPMFGAAGVGYEFDFTNPVPEDQELASAILTAKVNAARTLYVDMHAERGSIVEALELPASLVFEEPPAPPEPAALPPANGAKLPSNVVRVPSWIEHEDPLAVLRGEGGTAARALPRGAVEAAQNAVDLSELQAAWERELDALLARWRDVTTSQRLELKRQVRDAVAAGDITALASLTADHERGAELLAAAMLAIAAAGAAAAHAEQLAQGQDVPQAEQDGSMLNEIALATALLLAVGLASSAGAEALRQYTPDGDADTIAAGVDAHLGELSEAHLRERLGGTLTRAQNLGRIAQFEAGPSARYFATEVLDKNTCQPCRDIDGKELPTLMAAMLAYGGSGYLHCAGTWRCRGTMIAVYE